MNKYIVNILTNLKLTSRDRMALFFSAVFPLMFFFIFAQMYGSGLGGGIIQVVASVLIIGVLGNGFFGAGMRAVSERETGILRRFKVAPTTALPIVVSSLVTGWVTYIPTAIMIIVLSHFMYGMPFPEKALSLAIFISFAVLAFRALGMIVASVVNSMQESQILIQILYLPMLFLSGATFPISLMPVWLQTVAQFLPASHLFTGMQGILIRKESLAENWMPLAALCATIFVGSLLAVKLFRWEKEDKIRTSGKLWLLAAFAPFLILGVYQAYSKESIAKNKQLTRELRRSHTFLIRGARIFVGDGTVIQKGAIHVTPKIIARLAGKIKTCKVDSALERRRRCREEDNSETEGSHLKVLHEDIHQSNLLRSIPNKFAGRDDTNALISLEAQQIFVAG